jgi:crotonobetainyl-CoA:carnitine CoA-transferase CaiB-like acyl-CoA transferase
LIDISQAEAMIRTLDWTWPYAGLTGRDRERAGNRDAALPPSGIYRCVDGFVAVSARDEEERAALRKVLIAAFPGLVPGKEGDPLSPEQVAAYAATRTREQVLRDSEEAGFSAAPVVGGREQYRDPHLRARGTVWELDDPLYGRIDEFGPVPKLSESPGRIKWTAKPVGYHNEQVFGGLLGLTAEEMEELARKKVIGKWADVPGARPPR